MKNKILCVIAVALLSSATASGAEIVGKWFAQIPRNQGPLEPTVFTFRVDRTELMGTVSDPEGEETAISDGKIDGDEISFAVIRNVNGNERKMVYHGTVAGDEIKFRSEEPGQGRPQEFVARREFQRDQDIPVRRPLRRIP